MSKWLLWIGSLLLLVAFCFLLQGIWAGLTQRYTMTPYAHARMTGAVGFAVLVLGWILRRRGK
jgi:uncharacterized membrane-anchored protein